MHQINRQRLIGEMASHYGRHPRDEIPNAVVQKGTPSLRRRLRWRTIYLATVGWGDVDSKLQEFAGDV